MDEEIRNRSRVLVVLSVLVEVAKLAFREDSLFRRGDEDLGEDVKSEKQDRFESRQSIAEVHEGGNEYKEMEDERSDIAERHGEGMGGFLCAIRDGVVLVSMVYSRQPQRHRATLLAGRVRDVMRFRWKWMRRVEDGQSRRRIEGF